MAKPDASELLALKIEGYSMACNMGFSLESRNLIRELE
jgi:hypothetical protein